MKDKMKQQHVFLAAAMCGVMTLCACTEEVMNDMLEEPTSHLSIQTRTGGNDPLVIPVRLYVFNDEEECEAVRSFNSNETMQSVSLAAGTYDIYVLGGADETRYVLPDKDTAQKSTKITLQEGKQLGELMATNAHVTLKDGDEHNLTLNLQRTVLLLNNISISDVPEDMTAVRVSIAGLYKSIQLDGTLTETGGSCTVDLTKQSDGTTWKLDTEEEVYILPSSGNPTLTVDFTKGSTTNSYVYNSQEALVANCKVNISGAYHAVKGATLTGTISSTAWSGEKTFALNFDEKEKSVTGEETSQEENNGNDDGNGGNNETPTNPYQVGDMYQSKYYVLAVDGMQLTLLSSTDQSNVLSSSDIPSNVSTKIAAALSSWSDSDISATWRLPSRAEANKIWTNKTTINNTLAAGKKMSGATYFYKETNEEITAFSIVTDTFVTTNITAATGLRPVTTITIE